MKEKIAELITIAQKVLLSHVFSNLCKAPLKKNSSTTAGITAITKVTATNPHTPPSEKSLSTVREEVSCICRHISSPRK